VLSLNSNGKIGRILLYPPSHLRFYSTTQLLSEIDQNSEKIKKLTSYTDEELNEIKRLVIRNIRFIDVELISKEAFSTALDLTKDVDIDDTEFVALAEYMNGFLWSGDRVLTKGLMRKNWQRIISTDELFRLL
jgi:predicted nucleic acid-binding protein